MQYGSPDLIFHCHKIHLSKELLFYSCVASPDLLAFLWISGFSFQQRGRSPGIVTVTQGIQCYVLMAWKVWIRLSQLNWTATVQPRHKHREQIRRTSLYRRSKDLAIFQTPFKVTACTVFQRTAVQQQRKKANFQWKHRIPLLIVPRIQALPVAKPPSDCRQPKANDVFVASESSR